MEVKDWWRLLPTVIRTPRVGTLIHTAITSRKGAKMFMNSSCNEIHDGSRSYHITEIEHAQIETGNIQCF